MKNGDILGAHRKFSKGMFWFLTIFITLTQLFIGRQRNGQMVVDGMVGRVVRAPAFHRFGPGSILGLGNRIICELGLFDVLFSTMP